MPLMEIRKGTISGTFDLKNVSTPPGGGKGGEPSLWEGRVRPNHAHNPPTTYSYSDTLS